jgi:hypothetical protein
MGSLAIPWLVRAHGESIKVNNEARVLDGTHAERRGMDDTACSRNDAYGIPAGLPAPEAKPIETVDAAGLGPRYGGWPASGSR